MRRVNLAPAKSVAGSYLPVFRGPARMTPGARTVLTVCRTCRPEGSNAADEPAGATLGRRTFEALRNVDPLGTVEIRSIACLAACSRSCAASVAAPGKFSFVVGGLEAGDAADLARFAALHAEAEDGVPAWRSRPEKIRKNTIARIPPPGVEHALVEEIATLEEDLSTRR